MDKIETILLQNYKKKTVSFTILQVIKIYTRWFVFTAAVFTASLCGTQQAASDARCHGVRMYVCVCEYTNCIG